jgi:hypothetical protein
MAYGDPDDDCRRYAVFSLGTLLGHEACRAAAARLPVRARMRELGASGADETMVKVRPRASVCARRRAAAGRDDELRFPPARACAVRGARDSEAAGGVTRRTAAAATAKRHVH